jgi:nitrite reductase/ring-hydroxylating ferredoxin subunit
MLKVSKIRLFLIVITTFLALVSCNRKSNDVIPDVYIDFRINLYDPQFISLTAIGGAIAVDKNTNNIGYPAAGFNENGIIIYSGPDGFYAYDRTCPHDYAVNGRSIRVNIDFIQAVCPECGTSYALSATGTPSSGIGRFPLKNYRTSFDGIYIRVWNK